MATHSSVVACRIPWMEEPGGLQPMGSLSRTRLSDFTFTFRFHALEKETATHSSILAWRIPGSEEPVGLWGPTKLDTTDTTQQQQQPPHSEPSSTSLLTRSLWVVPEHWLWVPCFVHRTCTDHSILHMVIYMFLCYSLKSCHPHLLPLSPKVCSLHLCLPLLPCMQGHWYHLSKFHIYALIYSVYLSLSDFTLYYRLQVHLPHQN